MAKVDILHVPYRGSAPATQDLLADQVDMIFDNIPGSLAQMAGGKVVGLAVTSLEHTNAVTPKHPSGQRLSEIADVVIDNRAPYGDTTIEVPLCESSNPSPTNCAVSRWMPVLRPDSFTVVRPASASSSSTVCTRRRPS